MKGSLYTLGMDIQNARTLLPAAQEQLWGQVIRFKQKWMSFVRIAEIVAVQRNTVAKWWKTYEHEGAQGLRSQRRGRRIGVQRTLLVEQELAILEVNLNKNPDQYKPRFADHTENMVLPLELCHSEYMKFLLFDLRMSRKPTVWHPGWL